MSRTLGLDDIPLDVFRGVVAFGMGRFTVGRLDGGMKVCGPEFEAWTAHEERQTTARDLRALVGALGFHQLRCVSRQWRATADEHGRNHHASASVALSRPTAAETKNLFGSITIVTATTPTSYCCVWASRATRCLLNCR